MADVKQDDKKVLFVRIRASSHSLLQLIAAHDAAALSNKAHLGRTIERLIEEGAKLRSIQLPSD